MAGSITGQRINQENSLGATLLDQLSDAGTSFTFIGTEEISFAGFLHFIVNAFIFGSTFSKKSTPPGRRSTMSTSDRAMSSFLSQVRRIRRAGSHTSQDHDISKIAVSDDWLLLG